MNDREFNVLSDKLFQHITDALDASAADVDFVQTGSGCFEIECGEAEGGEGMGGTKASAGGGGIVVNRHEPSQEIWVAARSGACHFRPEGGQWRDTRTGEEIRTTLSRLIREQTGLAVSFD